MNFENQNEALKKLPLEYTREDDPKIYISFAISSDDEQQIQIKKLTCEKAKYISKITRIVDKNNTNNNHIGLQKIELIKNDIDNLFEIKKPLINNNEEIIESGLESSIKSSSNRKKIFKENNIRTNNFDANELLKKYPLPDWVDPYKLEKYNQKIKREKLEKIESDNASPKEITNSITHSTPTEQHLTLADLSGKQLNIEEGINEISKIYYINPQTSKLHPQSKDFITKFINSSFSKILSLFYPSQKNSTQKNYQEISEKVIKLQLQQDPRLKPRVNKTLANKLN